MLERRGSLGLAQEPLAKALVRRVLRGEQLERDVTLQSRVVRPVHDTHSAAPDERLEAVVEDLGSDARVGADRHGFVAYVAN